MPLSLLAAERASAIRPQVEAKAKQSSWQPVAAGAGAEGGGKRQTGRRTSLPGGVKTGDHVADADRDSRPQFEDAEALVWIAQRDGISLNKVIERRWGSWAAWHKAQACHQRSRLQSAEPPESDKGTAETSKSMRRKGRRASLPGNLKTEDHVADADRDSRPEVVDRPQFEDAEALLWIAQRDGISLNKVIERRWGSWAAWQKAQACHQQSHLQSAEPPESDGCEGTAEASQRRKGRRGSIGWLIGKFSSSGKLKILPSTAVDAEEQVEVHSPPPRAAGKKHDAGRRASAPSLTQTTTPMMTRRTLVLRGLNI